MSSLSDMLVYLRKRESLSQTELASKTGLKRSAIGMYETGRREPDLETLEIFADFYNVNLDTLTGKSLKREKSKLGKNFSLNRIVSENLQLNLEVAERDAKAKGQPYSRPYATEVLHLLKMKYLLLAFQNEQNIADRDVSFHSVLSGTVEFTIPESAIDGKGNVYQQAIKIFKAAQGGKRALFYLLPLVNESGLTQIENYLLLLLGNEAFQADLHEFE